MNAITQKMVEALFFHDVHFAPERVFEVCNQAPGEERGRVGPGLDEKIEVAIGPRFAPHEGTEDLHAGYSMPVRDRQNPIPVN